MPDAVTQAHGLPEAEVKLQVFGCPSGRGRTFIRACATTRGERKGLADDKVARWRAVIGIIATIIGGLVIAADISGRWRRHANHIGTADQASEGIVAASGHCTTDHCPTVIKQGHRHAIKRRFAAIDQAIVVIILPDIIADREFIEAEVKGLIAIGVDAGQVARVAAFIATT